MYSSSDMKEKKCDNSGKHASNMLFTINKNSLTSGQSFATVTRVKEGQKSANIHLGL